MAPLPISFKEVWWRGLFLRYVCTNGWGLPARWVSDHKPNSFFSMMEPKASNWVRAPEHANLRHVSHGLIRSVPDRLDLQLEIEEASTFRIEEETVRGVRLGLR